MQVGVRAPAVNPPSLRDTGKDLGGSFLNCGFNWLGIFVGIEMRFNRLSMSLIRACIIKGHLIQCNYWLQVEGKSFLLSILACRGEKTRAMGFWKKKLRHFVCNRIWDEYLSIGMCVYRMPAEGRCKLQITQKMELQLWTKQHGFWELNSEPLQEPQVLLMAEPSPEYWGIDI